jgi:hypothetical protein
VLRALFFAFVLVFSPGCGLIFQTVVGWNSSEKVTKTENKSVEVTSVPPGAQVTRRDPSGQETQVGTAPLHDTLSYQVEETVESPSAWALVVGSLVDTAGSIALLAVGASSSNAALDPGALLALMAGSLGILVAIPELIVAAVHGLGSPSVTGRKVVGGAAGYAYAGKLEGYPEAVALVKVPDQSRAQIVLDQATLTQLAEQKSKSGGGGKESSGGAQGVKTSGSTGGGSSTGGSSSGGSSSAGSGAKADAAWVIAVMDVEDLNASSRDKAIDPSLVRNLGDQIRIFIAERGVRTIDRGTQDKAIKDQISSIKKESYNTCYDDSCQIELGKALAASHILRSRITRFGRRCVLNAELIDLRSEVTMAASSSQGDCEAEGFLTMSEAVATRLIRR